MVTTSYPLRVGQAAGHFVAAEVQQLSLRHDVVVIAPGLHTEATGSSPRLLRIPGRGLFGPPGVLARVRRRPLRAWGGLEFCVRARRLLEREGPFDRVVAHWLVPCAWPIAASHQGELEAVAHGSDVRLLAALPALLRQRIARGWLERGLRVRCVSNELRDELLACTTPRLAAQLRVEPPPFSLEPRPERARARCSLGIDEQVRLALLVARLIPEKRVEVALRAVGQLPGLVVVVVGGGPLLGELRQRFPNVRFTGELARPQALAWIAAADVLISASKREGAPTALREARALNVPVVACAAGDLAEHALNDPGLWIA